MKDWYFLLTPGLSCNNSTYRDLEKGSFNNYVDRILPFLTSPEWTVFIP